METVHAMCIIADHPVPERLAVHAGRLRSFLPAHARKRISDREQAPRHARVGLSLGELAQRRWSPIPSYGQRRHDAFSESRRIGNHDPAHRVIRRSATGVILSVRRYYTITQARARAAARAFRLFETELRRP